MKIYINELSFAGQAQSLEEASVLLHSLAQVASRTKEIRGDNIIERHSHLLGKEILGNRSLGQLFEDIEKTDNIIVKDRIRVFLLKYGKGPFFDRDLSKNFPNHTCMLIDNQEDVSGSCLAASALSPSGGAIISVQNSYHYTASSIKVGFRAETRDDEKKKYVRNYCDIQSVENDIWRYESNPKHEPETRRIKGRDWTHMDLSPEFAQGILSCGIKYGKDVYSRHKEQWYIFKSHHKNYYHGYPIAENKVPKIATDKWKEVGCNEGQIEL